MVKIALFEIILFEIFTINTVHSSVIMLLMSTVMEFIEN